MSLKSKVKSPKSGVRSAGSKGATGEVYASAWELDSTPFAWDNRWGIPMEAAAAGAFSGDDVMRPPTGTIFMQARRWHRLHAFIRNVVNFKLGLHNHGLLGLRVLPGLGKGKNAEETVEYHPGIRAVNGKDTERLNQWKAANAEEIGRVVLDAWLSFILVRNVVALAMLPGGRVIIKPPEGVKYKDIFGNEELTIKHGLTQSTIDGIPGLTKKQRARLQAEPTLKITHDDPMFWFKVLKEEPVGMGFGWPDLATVFHACALTESLVVGDRQLADACRSVYEQHKLGHQIQSGNSAGSPVHFPDKKRFEATEKTIKSKKGHIQMATRFDHAIEIGAGRPKAEQYDTKRYAEGVRQLAEWGMPYGQMLQGVINPYLMTLAKAPALNDQQRMQPYLSELIGQLGAPGPVMMVWDHTCFLDARTLVDVMKAGMTGGPISGETFLRSVGLDPADERAAKGRDAELPPELTTPIFDPNHGGRPGQGPNVGSAKPGKPAGKNDRS